MVLRAIIKDQIDSFTYRLYIPKFNSINKVNSSFEAKVCSQINSNHTYRIDDSVYVSFENDDNFNPVILGLVTDDSIASNVDINSGNITNKAILPFDTTIGNISAQEINSIKGLKSNLNDQLKHIDNEYSSIFNNIDDINNNIKQHNSRLLIFDTSIKSINDKIDLENKLIGDEYDESEDTIFGRLNASDKLINLIKQKIGNIDNKKTVLELLENLYIKYLSVEKKSKQLLDGSTNNNYGDKDSDCRTSNRCIEFIKACEGFITYAKWDYAQWSIGYGCGCNPADYPNGITVEEATKLLKKYVVDVFEPAVSALENKRGEQFNQNQFDALISFTYNLGVGQAKNSSVYAMLSNSSRIPSAAEVSSAFGAYCHAGGMVLQGLVARRAAEAKIFSYGVYEIFGKTF